MTQDNTTSLDWAQLRQSLVESFDDNELRDLCFDLRIDYESLPGDGKSAKARELVQYCDRHKRLDELHAAIQRAQSNHAVKIARRECHSTLPIQPYFFGREQELAIIADAIAPEARTWGVLIDGSGGIGKTALAVQAGHAASTEQFEFKLFLSAKMRELTPQGEQEIADFMLPNYMALLRDLACEIGEDVQRLDPNERAKAVTRALAQKRALIVIDNLETFDEKERVRVLQFLGRLPAACKAIVTSRRRADVDARAVRLDRMEQKDALDLMAALAQNNRHLARTTERERQELYEITNGNPLLIRWTAGQLGRAASKCRTVADAVAFMQSAPPGNDPLEYIFGDLLDTFTESETLVLAALSHFTLSAKTKWIAEMTGLSFTAAQTALEDLTDRALAVADVPAQVFAIGSFLTVFLRYKRPESVARTGILLSDLVYALVLENGYENYERFPVLEAEWPAIAAALPLFVRGDNNRLQCLCDALYNYLNFYGRWDERLSLNQQAEERAVFANDMYNAGWRANDAGRVFFWRGQASEVLACVSRAEKYWTVGTAGVREKAITIRLRGLGYQLAENYSAAIAAFQESLCLLRTLDSESRDIAKGLNELADVKRSCGDHVGAESDYREALRIAKKISDSEGQATFGGSLAALALDRGDWPSAELLAKEALSLAEAVQRQHLIAAHCCLIAQSLARQGCPAEGLPYATRAVDIYFRLRAPDQDRARAILKECEEAATDGLRPSG